MMYLHKLVMLLLLLALGGCATQPEAPDLKPGISTSGDETGAQASLRIHTELAAGYFELGNMGVALEEVGIVLRTDPNYAPAHNIAGQVYTQLKEDRLAQQSFERALRISPLDSVTNHNYGTFLCQRQREEEGIKHLLSALRNPLYQNAAGTYVNVGLCARRRGDTAAAEEYFAKALQLRPNQPQALYHAADIQYQRNNFQTAKSYLERFTKVTAPNAEVLWLAVRVARKLGDDNSMASYAQQLRNNFPKSKEAGALLAGQYD
jgi:type IV pilus assembly protein PilF